MKKVYLGDDFLGTFYGKDIRKLNKKELLNLVKFFIEEIEKLKKREITIEEEMERTFPKRKTFFERIIDTYKL
jgi:hypothetical protein